MVGEGGETTPKSSLGYKTVKIQIEIDGVHKQVGDVGIVQSGIYERGPTEDIDTRGD